MSVKRQKPKKVRPAQKQAKQPGKEYKMRPRPAGASQAYLAAGKLRGKTAIVTGGDSGIGRAVSVLFAKEGADVVIVYLNEHRDAKDTQALVEAEGRHCLLIPGDVGDRRFCDRAMRTTIKEFDGLDILVNNAGEQHPQKSLEDITDQQWDKTFRTNIYGYFYLTRAALKHLKPGSVIINTTSVTAYEGHPELMDYASTKGAIVAFTRSLSGALADKKIRVNGVAPGPIWTPLIPATFSRSKVAKFGTDTPLGRAGQPEEVAPCYVFLASEDSSYMTGQILHPNGGRIVNG